MFIRRSEMTEEQFKKIRAKYPLISKDEISLLTPEEFNKLSIAHLELLIKESKDFLQELFKSGKSWSCSEEDLEWLKNFVREQKNYLETYHKGMVSEQKNIREGLNPTFCYKYK